MILYLNTTDINKIHFALISATSIKQIKHLVAYNEHSQTLIMLQQFLKTNKAISALGQPLGINAIVVCSGPGSFTGTRVGVTIAQALAFGWSIPAQAVSINQIPKNLTDLLRLKKGKKITVEYNRPAY